ncbi:MAG TPA: DUF4254 domain-containing protein [Acidimicrobiales bacterium]|nr:DUF4254 domain-containing protein [Acidimicrobiales bacterium]
MTAHLVLPPAADIVAEIERAVERGPKSGTPTTTTEGPTWATLVVALVNSNLRQWDLEDTTRDPEASDTEVANAKREIDRLNIGRHRLVEEIDAAIDSALSQPDTGPIATESPGMVLDRLSVLVIRRARTASALSSSPGFADRALALESQVVALSVALDCYLDELRAGTRRFLRYESFKLYGGPATAVGSAKE